MQLKCLAFFFKGYFYFILLFLLSLFDDRQLGRYILYSTNAYFNSIKYMTTLYYYMSDKNKIFIFQIKFLSK